eukprot:scaffold43552_cov75-Phaeocystis_antarctica.AAC.2
MPRTAPRSLAMGLPSRSDSVPGAWIAAVDACRCLRLFRSLRTSASSAHAAARPLSSEASAASAPATADEARGTCAATSHAHTSSRMRGRLRVDGWLQLFVWPAAGG